MSFFFSARGSVRAALVIIVLLTLVALTSQWWLPDDPQAIDLPSRLLSPDAQHWLCTDHLGRDIFSRLMAATRVSLVSVMAYLHSRRVQPLVEPHARATAGMAGAGNPRDVTGAGHHPAAECPAAAYRAFSRPDSVAAGDAQRG